MPGSQLTLTRQQMNTLASGQNIPLRSLVAHNRHSCQQEFYGTNRGRMVQFQFFGGWIWRTEVQTGDEPGTELTGLQPVAAQVAPSPHGAHLP